MTLKMGFHVGDCYQSKSLMRAVTMRASAGFPDAILYSEFILVPWFNA